MRCYRMNRDDIDPYHRLSCQSEISEAISRPTVPQRAGKRGRFVPLPVRELCLIGYKNFLADSALRCFMIKGPQNNNDSD